MWDVVFSLTSCILPLGGVPQDISQHPPQRAAGGGVPLGLWEVEISSHAQTSRMSLPRLCDALGNTLVAADTWHAALSARCWDKVHNDPGEDDKEMRQARAGKLARYSGYTGTTV